MYAYQLRDLCGSPFIEKITTSSVVVLIELEPDDSPHQENALSALELTCWPLATKQPENTNGCVHPRLLPGIEGVAGYSWEKSPGCYWVSVKGIMKPDRVYAVNVLEGRMAMLLFAQDRIPSSDERQVFHFLPPLRAGQQASDSGLARFLALQRATLIQRQYMANKLQAKPKHMRELIKGEWTEPLSAVLAGFNLLPGASANNKLLRKLDKKSKKMAAKFEALADSHVLQGMVLSHRHEEGEAKDSFEKARSLDAIPLTRESLELLHEGNQAPSPHVHENVESSETRDTSSSLIPETHIEGYEALDWDLMPNPDQVPQKWKIVKPEEDKILQDTAGSETGKAKLQAALLQHSSAFAEWFDQQSRLDPFYQKRIKSSIWTAIDLNDF